jgi:hypothetical protein
MKSQTQAGHFLLILIELAVGHASHALVTNILVVSTMVLLASMAHKTANRLPPRPPDLWLIVVTMCFALTTLLIYSRVIHPSGQYESQPDTPVGMPRSIKL